MEANKEYKGKTIYNPSGAAGEYAKWACNLYVGCSNGCEYCYCKKGILAHAMGQDKPQLKSGLDNDYKALDIVLKECEENLPQLQEHGLFFTFSSDPFLPECIDVTFEAMVIALEHDVPVVFLTKRAEWVYEEKEYLASLIKRGYGDMLAFGFTLTGHDELERNASINADRISAMRQLRKMGFKTWVSIEPAIDLDKAFRMIELSKDACTHYKVGLLTGSGKEYDVQELKTFLYNIQWHFPDITFYIKDSFIKKAKIRREDLPQNCVDSDYKLFTPKAAVHG